MVLPEPIIWYDDTNYVWVIGKDNASGKWTLSKKIVTGEFDRDKQTITFAPEDMIGFYVATPDLSSAMGFYETASDITFTRNSSLSRNIKFSQGIISCGGECVCAFPAIT